MGNFFKDIGKFVQKVTDPGKVKAQKREARALRDINAVDAVERDKSLASIPPPPAWVTAPTLPVNGGAPVSESLATENATANTSALYDALASQEEQLQMLRDDAQSGHINSLNDQRQTRTLVTGGIVVAVAVVGVIIYVMARR